MSRRLRFLLIIAAALLLSASTTWYWLLHTASGAMFVWSSIQQKVPGELDAGSVQGDLSGGLRVTNLRFRNEAVQVSVEETNLTLDVDLVPLSLEVSVLDVRAVDVYLPGEGSEGATAKTDIANILSAMRLPVVVNIVDVRMADLTLTRPGQQPQSIVSSVQLAGRLYDELRLERLEIVSPIADFSSVLVLGLQPPFTIDVKAEATISDIGDDGTAGLELAAELNGDWRRINLDLSSQTPDLSVTGTIENAFNQPDLDLRAQSSHLAWPIRSNDPELELENIDVRVVGWVSQYRLHSAAEIHVPDQGDLALDIVGSGTPGHLDITAATASGDHVNASATGELDWSAGIDLVADVVVGKFDPHLWLTTWPESYPLQGKFSGRLHNSDVVISLFEIKVLDTYMYVSGRGGLDTQENVVAGELSWRGLQWPIDTDKPAIVSKSGAINVNGDLAAWVVDGAIMLQSQALPEGRLTVSGSGDRDAIALTLHNSDILGGNVSGYGNYRWRDNHSFGGSLQIDQLHTAAIVPDWPGTLYGDVEIAGAGQPFAININVAELHGNIGDQALAASGALSFAPGEIEFQDFEVIHGGSNVALDGTLYGEEGLAYQLRLDNLGDYTDAVTGSIAGSGSVSLNSAAPRVRGDLSADRIAIGDIEIATLRIEGDAVGDTEFINHRIVARELQLGDQTIDTLSITAIGDADTHDLEIDLQSEDVVASLSASGALVNWQEPTALRWQGEIREFLVESADEPTLSLGSPALLDISASELLFEQSCLNFDSREAFCARAHWIKAGSVDVAAELRGAPLSALSMVIDTGLDFTQELTGQMAWSSKGSAAITADANIEISPGRIFSAYDSELALETGKGVIGLQIVDGEPGSITIDLPLPGYGTVDIDVNADNLELGAASPISGNILIDLSDIRVLAEFIPFIESDGGRLATDIAVIGTLEDPSVIGDVEMREGNIRYLPLGTTLSDLQIDATILEDKQLNLEGRFRAGDGKGTVVTTAAYEQGSISNLEFKIQGSDLLLIDSSEIRLVADADVKIGVRKTEMLLDGVVHIPEALVKPAVIPRVQILESKDLTVVAGDHPDKQPEANYEQEFRINGNLQVAFGDGVTVEFDVARAKLGGSVLFEWRGELMPIAKGVYTVDGTIAALGQLLNVSEGTIRFREGPANNPSLRISAQREIFGNTQVKTAGVLLTGTLQKPVMEAFTYPVTTEERALTLLATGSDFDYEQGVGALDFGMYIAPRLYLSYGIGLFEPDKVLGARYDLKKGFGIKATSGQRDSGIDLSYRVDK